MAAAKGTKELVSLLEKFGTCEVGHSGSMEEAILSRMLTLIRCRLQTLSSSSRTGREVTFLASLRMRLGQIKRGSRRASVGRPLPLK